MKKRFGILLSLCVLLSIGCVSTDRVSRNELTDRTDINLLESNVWISCPDDPLDVKSAAGAAFGENLYAIGYVDSEDDIRDTYGSLGSGFFVTANRIITCYHVAEMGNLFIDIDGKSFPEDVVYADPNNDISLLQVEGYDSPYILSLDTKANYTSGDHVTVLGYPLSEILSKDVK